MLYLDLISFESSDLKLITAKEIESYIKEYGPCVAQVEDPLIGKHNVIIDGIGRGILDHYASVTIRDPFHGWRITIPLRVLKALQPRFYQIS